MEANNKSIAHLTLLSFCEEQYNSFIKKDFLFFCQDKKDYKNGYYNRFLETECGLLSLRIPRLRHTGYIPSFILPYKRQSLSFILEIIGLIREENFVFSRVKRLLQKIYGISLSDTHLRFLIKNYSEDVNTFFYKSLSKDYKYIMLDGTYIGKGNKCCLMSALGIDEDGNKEILTFRIAQTENLVSYREILTELVKRGLTDVKCIIADGFLGLDKIAKEVYKNALFGQCFLHYERAISRSENIFIEQEEKKAYINDLRRIVKSDLSFKESQTKLKAVLKKHSHLCELLNISYIKLEHLISFKIAPKKLWKTLYTTNPIELYHKHLKRNFKHKGHFKSRDNLLLFISSFCLKYCKT